MLGFALYVIGSIVCIAAIAWIATFLGASSAYVTGVAGLLFAAAFFAALAHKREAEAG